MLWRMNLDIGIYDALIIQNWASDISNLIILLLHNRFILCLIISELSLTLKKNLS